VYSLLANAVDVSHALAMLLWGLGLPLLFWHRSWRLSSWYMAYALVFVVVSVLSHQLLGECFLTTLSRKLWLAGGGYRNGAPFTARLVNSIAGIHPTDREVVLAWEVAIALTSLGGLWFWLRAKRSDEIPKSCRPGRPRKQKLRTTGRTRQRSVA
jgi:hypothetical protein